MEEKMLPETQEPAENNNSKLLVVVAIVAVVLGGAYFVSQNKALVNPNRSQNVTDEKVFELSTKPFEFSQKEIRVKKGDRVRINLIVAQGMHDWVIDEFNARTKQIKTGESDSIVFVADRAGTFEYYCSVGNHRQMGMVGKLIVE